MRRSLRHLLFFVCAVASSQTPASEGFGILSDPGTLSIVRNERNLSVDPARRSAPVVLVAGDQITNTGSSLVVIDLYPGLQQIVLTGGSTIELNDPLRAMLSLEYGRMLLALPDSGVGGEVSVQGRRASVQSGSLAAEFYLGSSGVPIERFTTISGRTTVLSNGGERTLDGGQSFDMVEGDVVSAQRDGILFWDSRQPSPAIPGDELLPQRPGLAGEVEATLGAVPEFLLPEPVVEESGEPTVEPEERAPEESESVGVAEVVPQSPPADTTASAAEDGSESDAASLFSEPVVTSTGVSSRLLSTIGGVLVGTGASVNGAALGYSWFGGALTGGSQLSRESTTQTLLLSGTGLMIGGMLFYALSLAAGN